MKVSYVEGIANHNGPESCATPGEENVNVIYEQDFLGSRMVSVPGRSPHEALDALTVGIMTKKVNWVLDADIRRFYDTLDHGWLVKFVEHRVADQPLCG